MNASPASALEVVPAQFFLDLAETSFHLPPCEGHAEQVAECPTPLSHYAIAEEVFCFTSEHVARYDQRCLTTNQTGPVRLAPTGVPLDFPNLRAAAGVLDAIPLRFLLDETRRITSQVLHFAGACVPTCQAGIVLRSSGPAFRGFSQHSGLRQPDVEVRRHLADERLAAQVESV